MLMETKKKSWGSEEEAKRNRTRKKGSCRAMRRRLKLRDSPRQSLRGPLLLMRSLTQANDHTPAKDETVY